MLTDYVALRRTWASVRLRAISDRLRMGDVPRCHALRTMDL
jgi:hypothetical protein